METMETDKIVGESPQQQGFSHAAIVLLKGIVSRGRDEAVWQEILDNKTRLNDYFHQIGLLLIIDEYDEYAYLKQEEGSGLPHIVSRHPLSYETSMLLVQLRKLLGEYDRTAGESRVVVEFSDILRRMEPFLPPQINEMKLRNSVGRIVSNAVTYGFLQPIKGEENVFEIRPILRRFVDAQWLDEFARKLAEYETFGQLRHAQNTEAEQEGGMMDELIRDDD